MTTRMTEEAADVVADLPAHSSYATSTRSRGVLDQYSPLSASDYFQEALSIKVDTLGEFRVYLTPPKPVSADSLSPFSNDYLDEEDRGSISGNGVVFVFHHGAGYCGLSAACFAKEVRQHGRGEFGVMSFDCRGHGSSRIGLVPTDPPDLSLSTLADDMVRLLKVIYPDRSTAPSLVLIGHSMGGSIVTEACARIQAEVTHVIGLAILDVVEGSAIASLPHMLSLVNLRPSSFQSKADCIKYHIESRTIRNVTSARVSVPGLISQASSAGSESTSKKSALAPSQSRGDEFTWITNLRESQPFWEGWYKDLSKKFLSQKTARLLVLAGTDRLDKDLMIGQMQGKYQLTVMADVGHCVHEDDPEKLAEVVITFCKRNETFTSEQILARLRKQQ